MRTTRKKVVCFVHFRTKKKEKPRNQETKKLPSNSIYHSIACVRLWLKKILTLFSQFTLATVYTLHQRPAVAQDDFPVDLCDEADLLPNPVLDLPGPPDLGDELLAGLDGGREPGLELLHVGRITAAHLLEEGVGRVVPAEEAVHDGATETHLLARFGSGM